MNDKGHFRFPEYAARRAFETNIFPSCYSNPVSPSSFLRPTWSTHNIRDMRWGASAPSLLLKSAPPSRGGELDTTLHEAEVEFVPNGTSLVSATIDETALRIRGQTSRQGDRDSIPLKVKSHLDGKRGCKIPHGRDIPSHSLKKRNKKECGPIPSMQVLEYVQSPEIRPFLGCMIPLPS